jgi:hypothetical protein
MFTPAEREQFARQACKDFVARTTVLVAPGHDLTVVGSGVLLRTERGRPFLLTARHLLERAGGWRPLRLAVPGLGGADLGDVGESAFMGPARDPDPVDVAVVTFRETYEARLRPLTAGIDAVGEDDLTDASDVVFLVGFPNYLGFRSEADPRVHLVSTLTYFTGVKGRDRHGRLEVAWGQAIPDADAPTYPHLKVQAGHSMQLGSPGGVSGGALWRVRGSTAGNLWSPSSHAKLIGVPVAWNQRDTEYAESVVAWGSWLRETALVLDARSTTADSGP